jgi:hypothetical protein
VKIVMGRWGGSVVRSERDRGEEESIEKVSVEVGSDSAQAAERGGNRVQFHL